MLATDPLSFQTWLSRKPVKYDDLITAIGDENLSVNDSFTVRSLARNAAQKVAGYEAMIVWERYRYWLQKEGSFRAWLLSGKREFVLDIRILAAELREDPNLPDSYDEVREYVAARPELPGPQELDTLWTLYMIHQLTKQKHLSPLSSRFKKKAVHSGYDAILCGPDSKIPEFPFEPRQCVAVRVGNRYGVDVFAVPDLETAKQLEAALRETITVATVELYNAAEIIIPNFIDELYLIIGDAIE